jgi:murein DD-endopeptidase MepM/ murein hydrolase activator NlpD
MNWKKMFVLLALLFFVGAGVWFLVVRMEREAPSLSFDEELEYIGKSTDWTFTAEDRKSGLREIRVWVKQGPKTQVAFAEDLPSSDWRARGGERRRDVTVTFDPRSLGLAEGAATVVVAAQDNSLWSFKGNSTFQEFPVVIDILPPRIDLLSTVHNVKKGGTGLVVFRLNEVPERAGVELGETFFPAYPEEGGGDGVYLAYFALPIDADNAVKISLTAEDGAGNEMRRTFPVRVLAGKFPRDTIRISDGFLARKVPEFQSMDPSLDTDLLKAYLTVNREWRERNHDRLRDLCSTSTPRRLWSGAFVQMENTKNMSAYAVRRNYVYKGRVVDKQVHLGLDLASTAGAPVPAANGGLVVFAEEIGIYGQTVVIDHGQGLFSLYSHLSGILVAAGDSVERGQHVGASGQTGMAGGDHLHFSILVSGEFVNPIEWLDSHWIADNIDNKLTLF